MLLTRRRLLYSALGSTASLLAGSEQLLARETAPSGLRCTFLLFGTIGEKPAYLAAMARQQVAHALAASGRWTIAPRPFPAEVALPSTGPYPTARQWEAFRQKILRLRHDAGADVVVSGDVTSIEFLEGVRRARATLAVRIYDSRTGYLINGATEVGLSPLRNDVPPQSNQVLYEEAITNAAFNVAKTVGRYSILPSATVVGTRSSNSNEVILNYDAHYSIPHNINMVIFRGSKRIARLQTIEANRGIMIAFLKCGSIPQVGDQATAIFELPGYYSGGNEGVRQYPLDAKDQTGWYP